MDLPSTILKIDPDDIVFRPTWMIQYWCGFSYPGHPKGCPNSQSCDFFREDLEDRVKRSSEVHLVWVEFDLDAQAKRMKEAHPNWTDKQCRNLLYWQRSVRKELRNVAKNEFPGRDMIIGAEGGGVDFYLTMRRLGIPLDSIRDLHKVRVIGLVISNGSKKLSEWM